ncbi:cytochrome P450 [Nocardia fluminea]|uniref:cytochrome P450 n=1 Tax=Nocardia fluminea TaxID=134984 RepID=UPI00364B1EA9
MRTEIEAIPFAPGCRPLLGHAVAFMNDPVAFLSSMSSGPPLRRIRLGALDAVLVCDAELTWKVLLDDRTFDKGGPFYERSREVAGNGLGTCRHDQHRRQRRLCQPAFRANHLAGYAELMATSIEKTLQSWNGTRVIDLVTEMSGLTVDISVRTMFSTSLPEPVVQRAARDVRVIAEGLFRRTVLPPLLNRIPTPTNLRFARSRQRIRALAAQMIDRRRSSRARPGDLLSALIGAHDNFSPSAVRLSDEELVDQIFTFFLAGVETTASTLTWALYALSCDRNAAGKVEAEVDRVLAGPTATLDDLAQLPAITRVLTETLRLYPPGWLLTREASATTELASVSIPIGTTVAISPHILHRRSELFPDPELFDPDRWIGTIPARNAYIAFGAGARRCIGDQFALVAASLALATITRRWTLSPTADRRLSVSLQNLPAPRTLPMQIRPRRKLEGTARTDAPESDRQ